jgi:hypothetical protein
VAIARDYHCATATIRPWLVRAIERWPAETRDAHQTVEDGLGRLERMTSASSSRLMLCEYRLTSGEPQPLER